MSARVSTNNLKDVFSDTTSSPFGKSKRVYSVKSNVGYDKQTVVVVKKNDEAFIIRVNDDKKPVVSRVNYRRIAQKNAYRRMNRKLGYK